MKKTKYWMLFLAVSVASGLWLLASLPSVSQPTVQLQANPPLNQVVPAAESVEITLQMLDADRQPLPDANVQVRLFTPPKTPWFTSDFPIVEGTTLLELNAIAPSGTLQFEQTLPIRGAYRLEVNVSPQRAGAFEPFEQSLTFSIPENPEKYRNLAILAAILLVAGAGGGWVIGGNQTIRAGEIAPKPARIVLSAATMLAIMVLLFVNINAELASSHTDDHSSETTSAPAVKQSQGIQAELSGDTQAVVGKTATQTVQIADATTGQPVSDVALKIQAIALEHNEEMFSYAGVPDQAGQLTWQEQFFDGAPHQITVEVLPLSGERQFQAFQVAHEVDVEGIAPPLYIRLIGLIYFTAIFIVGLIAGLWLRRRTRLQRL